MAVFRQVLSGFSFPLLQANSMFPHRQVRLQVIRTYSNSIRPRKTKFKKFHKRIKILKSTESIEPKSVPAPPLQFYEHGIYALESWRITDTQIEACRLALVRKLAIKTKDIKILVFPHIPVTKKPFGTRMGKGKGSVDHFIAFVKAGKMLFEFSGGSNVRNAFRAINSRLPIKVGFVEKLPETEKSAQ